MKRMAINWATGHGVLMGVWCVFLMGGSYLIYRFETIPGEQVRRLSAWPDGSVISRPEHYPILVSFMHPRCACSEASLSALESIESRFGEELEIRIVFWLPEDPSSEWTDCDLVESARKKFGDRVYLDFQGIESDRFAANTSGESFLFNKEGRLLMQGGLTPRRSTADADFAVMTIDLALQGKGVLFGHTYGCAF